MTRTAVAMQPAQLQPLTDLATVPIKLLAMKILLRSVDH